MKIHRFFINHTPTPGELFLTDEQVIHQITRVLRLSPGEHIALCDNSGYEWSATILNAGKKEVRLDVGEKKFIEEPNEFGPALACAILKKDNFEWVVQKATELGISTIIPINTARTIKSNLNFERLRTIAREASEQSGRGSIPHILDTMTLPEALNYAQVHYQDILLCDGTGTHSNTSFSKGIAFIGPEGGWTGDELESFTAMGIESTQIAPHTLRAETAAIIATYLVIQ